jgi:hypothetical protein
MADALAAARALCPDSAPAAANPHDAATRASLPLRTPQTPTGPPGQIVLEAVAVPTGAVTASFSGYDTGAPRALDLWRLVAGRAVRLGRAASDAETRIHAPQLPLPDAGIDLVVTPAGVRPGGPGASDPLRLAWQSERDPRAPAPEGPRNPPRWRPAPAEASPREEIQ